MHIEFIWVVLDSRRAIKTQPSDNDSAIDSCLTS